MADRSVPKPKPARPASRAGFAASGAMKYDEPDTDDKPKRGGKRRYSDDELGTMLDRHLRRSLGAPGSEISQLRIRNLQYYSGEAVGEMSPPAVPDRSSIVSTDVADTVEWMLPQLMRVFAASPDAMECEARTQAFAPKAKLASEYMRHVFWKRCRGINVIHPWFRDGLTQKVGFVRVDWDKKAQDTEETYVGLTAEEAAPILDDPNVEALEQTARKVMVQLPVPDGQPPQPPAEVEVFDIKIQRRRANGRCKVVAIPPEEMRIHPRARYGEEPLFIAQEYYRTRGELEAEGYDLSDVGSGGEEENGQEQVQRQNMQQIGWADDDEGELERFRVALCYIQLDQDGDGTPEWLRVLMIGNKVKEQDKADGHPFVWFCPVPLSHVFFGMCPADQAIEPQRLGTSLMRALLDNTYLTVNQRTFGIEGRVNLDDLTSNRPGGHVRVKSMDSLQPIVQPQLGQAAWQMVEWSDSWRETRTGFTRYSKGLKADALAPQTATGANLIADRDDMRMELMARIAGESMRVMFEKLLKCMSRYQDVEDEVELFGQWVKIDPREWANGFTISVNVGLGTGNKDKRSMVLREVLQIQAPMAQAGKLPPQAVIAAARKFCEAADLGEAEQYFPDPPPPQPPQPPLPLLIEQEKGKQDAQKTQAQLQADLQKSQASLQLQASNDQRDGERQVMQAQMNAQLQQMAEENKRFLGQLAADTERYKADLQAQTQLTIEAMRQEHQREQRQFVPPAGQRFNGAPPQ